VKITIQQLAGVTITLAVPGSMTGPIGPLGVSLTLNWAAGIVVAPGTYVLIGTAAYTFVITSLDASIGSAGGQINATVRNAGVPVDGLDGIDIALAEKTRFAASGSSATVAAGATVDVLLTVSSGLPTDTFLALNGTKV
jgi:hypothetical protein